MLRRIKKILVYHVIRTYLHFIRKRHFLRSIEKTEKRTITITHCYMILKYAKQNHKLFLNAQ
jgi:hypothetical protein